MSSTHCATSMVYPWLLWRARNESVRWSVLAANPQSQRWWYCHPAYQPSNQVLIHSLSHPLLFRQTPAVKMFSFSSANKTLLSRTHGVFAFALGNRGLWKSHFTYRGLKRAWSNSSTETANPSIAHGPTEWISWQLTQEALLVTTVNLPKKHLTNTKRGTRTSFWPFTEGQLL